MMHIALPQKELRLLGFQIQKFEQGYTVEQIRILDKIVSNINKALEDFSVKIKDIKENKEITDEEVTKFFEEEGSKMADLALEDDEFQFVMLIWSRMNTLSGDELVRKSIIIIDDALKSATQPVFNKIIN